MTATPTPLRELERDPRDFANEGNPTRCAAVWNEALLAGAEAAIAPLVEFFRAEGYQRFGWDGDVRGWTPVQTAIAAMRAALSARDAAGAGVQICTFADCTCDALHTTTSGEPIDHATPTPLRELIAKAIADHIGHGMAEKCEGHADAVLAALSARDAAGAVPLPADPRDDTPQQSLARFRQNVTAGDMVEDDLLEIYPGDYRPIATQPASGEAEELAALLERLSSHSLVGAANYGDARGTAICTRAAAFIRRPAAVAPAGMVLVPREADETMRSEMHAVVNRTGGYRSGLLGDMYRAAIAAAPTPPATAGEEGRP